MTWFACGFIAIGILMLEELEETGYIEADLLSIALIISLGPISLIYILKNEI